MAMILDTVTEAVQGIEPNQAISANDQMFHGNKAHYFGVGRSAMLLIATALAARAQFAGGEKQIRKIFDFGCGHGRVARFLRAAFPGAELTVTDHVRGGVAWCVDELGCLEISEPESLYDLIWVGSVLTHLPEQETVATIVNLRAKLADFGILVYTTHGRVSATGIAARLRDSEKMSYGITEAGARDMLQGYWAKKFGYCDYPQQTGYGISIGTLGWFIEHTCDEETQLLLAQERGWDTHQDALAFVRVTGGAKRLERGRLYSEKPSIIAR